MFRSLSMGFLQLSSASLWRVNKSCQSKSKNLLKAYLLIDLYSYYCFLFYYFERCCQKKRFESVTAAENSLINGSKSYFWNIKGENRPGNMGASIHKYRLKVFGEFWSFFLAVLNNIICQIKESQLPAAFSWNKEKQHICKGIFHFSSDCFDGTVLISQPVSC